MTITKNSCSKISLSPTVHTKDCIGLELNLIFIFKLENAYFVISMNAIHLEHCSGSDAEHPINQF